MDIALRLTLKYASTNATKSLFKHEYQLYAYLVGTGLLSFLYSNTSIRWALSTRFYVTIIATYLGTVLRGCFVLVRPTRPSSHNNRVAFLELILLPKNAEDKLDGEKDKQEHAG